MVYIPDKNLLGFPKALTQDIDGSTRIIDGTLTGTQFGINPNFPGKTVQAGNNNVVVQNTNSTNNLAVIRATFASGGSLVGGEGILSSVSAGTGRVTIAWAVAFADTPTVVVTPIGSLGDALMAVISSASTVGVNVTTSNATATNVDVAFNIIAIGQRA